MALLSNPDRKQPVIVTYVENISSCCSGIENKLMKGEHWKQKSRDFPHFSLTFEHSSQF